MARFRFALVAIAILPGFVSGQQSPLSHTVVRGETLWGLAQRYYQDPFEWPRIWEANRAGVEDPNLIFPSQNLVIPGMTGLAVVGDVDVRQNQALPAANPEPEGDARTRNRTVFYRDPVTGSGVTGAAERAYFAVPRHTVYSAKWLVPNGEEAQSIGAIDGFMESGELRTATPYTRVQIGMAGNHGLSVGDRLQSFRPGRDLAGVGQVMEPSSVMTVTRVEEAGLVAVVMDAFDRVREGDMVRPAPTFDLEAGDLPDAITSGGTALVIGFSDYHALQNMGDIAFLDQGDVQGVSIGDEYILYTGDSEGWSGDVVGRLQVVGTRGNTASARIVAVEGPAFVDGVTVHLDRKMR